MARAVGSLRWRLLAAFLVVAVGAVALLALVAVVSVDQRTATLAAAQRAQLRTQVAAALAAAYTAGQGTWTPTDLTGVQALAGAHHMGVAVADAAGQPVASYTPGHHGWELPTRSGGADGEGHDRSGAGSPDHQGSPATPAPDHRPAPSSGVPDRMDMGAGAIAGGGSARLAATAPTAPVARAAVAAPRPAGAGTDTVTVPIVVDGKRVGTATLTLPTAADPAVATARAALLRTVGAGAVLAAVLAAVAALFVARRMSRPVVALTAATRAFAAGEPDADRLIRAGPGELGELGDAFRSMAATVRRQEELRRSLVADVAHELRTPVTVLRGQTEALLDGVAEPTPETLVSLHDEVLRLGRLTDDLAGLSAADAAGLSLRSAPVDLGALVRRATDALAAGFTDAELTVRTDVADGVVVAGDDGRLTQVVTNLLTNAAKYTPAGGTVSVTVARDADTAVLTVADTGPGIPAAELPHVFDRFWRGSAATGRGGTGIGLAVVRAVVTAHGGTVTAAGAPGGGARFSVRLPARPAQRR